MPIDDDLHYITQSEKRHIQDDAYAVLEANGIQRPPVPTYKIILGQYPHARVIKNGSMPASIKGIGILGLTECDIHVNPIYPIQSRRFTLMHECGHFMCGESGCYISGQKFRSSEEKYKEQKANCYAAALLMPENMIRRYYRVYQNFHVMAKIFNVSFTAMVLRLKHLELVDPEWAEMLIGVQPSSRVRIIKPTHFDKVPF